MSGILLLVLPQHFWYNRILEYKMRRKVKTKEEKVAQKFLEAVADLTLNLDEVGREIALTKPVVLYNRFITIADAATDTIDKQEDIGYN
jgi:hypothetical protein